MMECSLEKEELKKYLAAQLDNFFPDNYKMKGNDINIAFNLALDRVENNFKYSTLPAYNRNQHTFFNHLHADQYATLLYYFSNSLWKVSENKVICDKIMYLNRILNNFMFSYKAKLPDIFLFGHPVGTVLGNADYSDFLVVIQNVTVNTAGTIDDLKPKLGKGLFLGSGAKIIGDRTIGDRVSIGTNVVLYNTSVEDDKIVCLNKGRIQIRERIKKECMAQQYFNVPIK